MIDSFFFAGFMLDQDEIEEMEDEAAAAKPRIEEDVVPESFARYTPRVYIASAHTCLRSIVWPLCLHHRVSNHPMMPFCGLGSLASAYLPLRVVVTACLSPGPGLLCSTETAHVALHATACPSTRGGSCHSMRGCAACDVAACVLRPQ